MFYVDLKLVRYSFLNGISNKERQELKHLQNVCIIFFTFP